VRLQNPTPCTSPCVTELEFNAKYTIFSRRWWYLIIYFDSLWMSVGLWTLDLPLARVRVGELEGVCYMRAKVQCLQTFASACLYCRTSWLWP
jgi:hypothetical protein